MLTNLLSLLEKDAATGAPSSSTSVEKAALSPAHIRKSWGRCHCHGVVTFPAWIILCGQWWVVETVAVPGTGVGGGRGSPQSRVALTRSLGDHERGVASAARYF